MPEYIARISYGKDSLKMLDVIHSRCLPLDRITTTDVWATDTILANLPPVEAFKAKIDQWILDRYRIEVEHLCARNKDGSKKTYEQMFYHVPVRRSQTVQVEREREREFRIGSILGFPDLWNPWCQAALKRASRPQGTWNDYRIPSKHKVQLVPETQGLPGHQSKDFRLRPGLLGVRSSKSGSTSSFLASPTRRARKEISWSISE